MKTQARSEATAGARGLPYVLSREARSLRRSMMRDLIAVTARPDVLSFAGGLPAPDLFPVEAWQQSTEAALRDDAAACLQYGPPYPPLQEAVAGLMRLRGADVGADSVFITSGAQQGLHVAARFLMDRGSAVVVDRFVFTGVRQAFGGRDHVLREVPTDPDTGLDLDALAAAAAGEPAPRAAVIIPSFHNPMGTTLSAEAAEAMLAHAADRGFAVVEDDPYGLLAFDNPPPATLWARDPERVIYLGSFSKIIAPGLRLGWIVAPPVAIERLRVLKESVDLETSQFIQRVAARFLADGHLEAHLAGVRRAYGRRRDAMLAALETHFPAGSRWSRPGGGMFVWVELPAGFDTMELLQPAIDAGVCYVPGQAFASQPSKRTMRLNFSNASVGSIETGIERLGDVLRTAQPLAATA